MDTHYSNVGAVNSTAHIDAAANGNPEVIGQLCVGKMVVYTIHNSLDKA
jgi:hypothetical protein